MLLSESVALIVYLLDDGLVQFGECEHISVRFPFGLSSTPVRLG